METPLHHSHPTPSRREMSWCLSRAFHIHRHCCPTATVKSFWQKKLLTNPINNTCASNQPSKTSGLCHQSSMQPTGCIKYISTLTFMSQVSAVHREGLLHLQVAKGPPCPSQVGTELHDLVRIPTTVFTLAFQFRPLNISILSRPSHSLLGDLWRPHPHSAPPPGPQGPRPDPGPLAAPSNPMSALKPLVL